MGVINRDDVNDLKTIFVIMFIIAAVVLALVILGGVKLGKYLRAQNRKKSQSAHML